MVPGQDHDLAGELLRRLEALHFPPARAKTPRWADYSRYFRSVLMHVDAFSE
jgi:hypothetical protein